MVFCLYFPRHGRKDMVVALFGINVGVLGVSFTLADAAVSAGLGLGLFGVLFHYSTQVERIRSARNSVLLLRFSPWTYQRGKC